MQVHICGAMEAKGKTIAVLGCGVDYISVGALTHSVKCLDMSFKAC